jgi:ADP-heptose:LPS heptosyltransferase
MNIKNKILSLSNKNKLSFLLCRTDRLGDLVLSIQCAEIIKKQYPNSKLSFMVRSYTAPILENNPFIDEILCVDKMSFFEIVKKFYKEKYDVVVFLFMNFKISLISFLVNVPVRLGPMSKLGTIFLNIRLNQKRSLCEKNEASYNIDLLNYAGIYGQSYPKIYLSNKDVEFGNNFYKNINPDSKKFIIVHPGSGNSSKNWPIRKFFELVSMLEKNKDIKVLVTGSLYELNSYKTYIDEYKISKDNILQKNPNLREFISIISKANTVVTNSTGPLHIASALNVKTIGFYSPVRVCAPIRWGVYSEDKTKHFVFMPNVDECKKCIGEKCKYFNCMDKIVVKEVYEKILGI